MEERVTRKYGAVHQSSFHDYPVLAQVGGAGVAPAVANAAFWLTGKPLRHMPFTPERVERP